MEKMGERERGYKSRTQRTDKKSKGKCEMC